MINEVNILICGKCAKEKKLTLEERTKLALQREKNTVYVCDQCGDDHEISKGLRGS
jgi:RNase P subunit RPR2